MVEAPAVRLEGSELLFEPCRVPCEGEVEWPITGP